MEFNINYTSYKGTKIDDFHHSDAFYRFLLGPVRGGKSVACALECFIKASQQAPNRRGIRKTRFAVARNTYGELLDTTINTWLDWFPEVVFGKMNWSDLIQTVRWKDIEMEVAFRALDRPDDIKKLLSWEVTGFWFNEVREMPKSLVDASGDRVGQYPAKRDGGCTWRGVIADCNMPDDDHWLYAMAEQDRTSVLGREVMDSIEQSEKNLKKIGALGENQKLYEFFKQSGGLIETADGEFEENPNAENIENLEPHYYLTRMAGKSLQHIRVYYCAQYGFVKTGRSVIPEYVDKTHCAEQVIEPVKGLKLYVGLDFGGTPAASFLQKLPNSRIIMVDELIADDFIGAVDFGDALKTKFMADFKEWVESGNISICGDPAGEQRAQTDKKTPFQIINPILDKIGLSAHKASTNDWTIRREAIAVPLGRLVDGKPRLMISPKCSVVRKGLAGGYYYRRIQVSGEERYQDEPVKNKFSHGVDSLGYGLLDMGEGDAIVNKSKKIESKSVSSIMARMGKTVWGGG